MIFSVVGLFTLLYYFLYVNTNDFCCCCLFVFVSFCPIFYIYFQTLHCAAIEDAQKTYNLHTHGDVENMVAQRLKERIKGATNKLQQFIKCEAFIGEMFVVNSRNMRGKKYKQKKSLL